MTATVAELARYREVKDTIAATVRAAVLQPYEPERFIAAMKLAGAVMQNHGWRRLRFPTFVLERGPMGLAMLRARDRAKEHGICPYCGSPYRTWVAGERIVHFGCLSCGGVYKEEVPLEDESA